MNFYEQGRQRLVESASVHPTADANTEAEAVAGQKGRKANYGVDRSAPRRAIRFLSRIDSGESR